mgnify:CR=1 FL=1
MTEGVDTRTVLSYVTADPASHSSAPDNLPSGSLLHICLELFLENASYGLIQLFHDGGFSAMGMSDEFIERIKGDQARRYTKRVLGSYFTYSYLADQTVPVVSNEVPRKLGRK